MRNAAPFFHRIRRVGWRDRDGHEQDECSNQDECFQERADRSRFCRGYFAGRICGEPDRTLRESVSVQEGGSYFEKADMAFANLETPVSVRGKAANKTLLSAPSRIR